MSVPYRLRKEAERFRTLAETADEQTAAYLRGLADDYEAEAERIDYGPVPEPPPTPMPEAS